MKVPMSWLKQFLPLTQTAEEIALHLTRLGIEVEAVTGHQVTFSDVVVGKTLAVEKHPNADRLRVARVTDGSQEYQVVCGAPNCREGLFVAFARVGAQLTDDDGKRWKIKNSKIRDVESQGMLCSLKELKIGEIHEGIVELSSDAPLGIDVAALLLDPIFDISLTPNLGHCQSILGIARELAASFNLKLHSVVPKVDAQGVDKMDVVIENASDCPRFACRIVKDVKVGPSPAWLQNRLKHCGLNPINNLVDIGNYMMLELGHPLHIFDRDQIKGSTLSVKQAPSIFSFETLDQKKREVPLKTLLICDQEKPLSLAGIMGGASSAVTETTKNIVIETAVFNPTSIRKASRLLDLKTDGSARFDRGVDPEAVVRALDHATELILQVAGGTACPITDQYPKQCVPRTIICRPSRVEQMLGFTLSIGEMTDLLRRLDMHVSMDKENHLLVTVPSYRNDLHLEIDLIEEIARLYGYDHIPRGRPVYSAGSLADSSLFNLETQAHELLLQEGLHECITCDLISPSEHELTREKEISNASTLRVLHPRSLDQSVLRTSLLPGLLKVAQHNLNHQMHNFALFEIGRIHYKEGDKIEEPTCAALLLSGVSNPAHFDRKSSHFDFFDLKGMIENLTSSLHLRDVHFSSSNLHTLHPWRQAQVKVGDTVIGVFGEIHPELVLKMNLQDKPLFAELNLNDILGLKKQAVKFHPLASYPSSSRDWTVTISSHLPFAKMASLIQSCKTPYLESFELIDSFSSKELGPDRKNVTFRFVYRDRHQTIATEIVDGEHRQLTHSVAEKLANLI